MMTPYIPAAADGATDASSGPLIALTIALSTAKDESAVLAASLGYLQRFGAQEVRLVYAQKDSQGNPREWQVVAHWQEGQTPAGGAERGALAADSIARLSLGNATEPLLFAESAQATPPSADAAPTGYEELVGSPSDCKAMALLPLSSEGGGVQALLAIFWTVPHTFSLAESGAYRLLMAVLGICISRLRSERELGVALLEAAVLHEVTKQLNVATSLQAVLSALLVPAPAREEAEVALCSIDPQPDGTPGWLTVIGTLAAGKQSQITQIGTRYYLPDIPFSKLYMSSPDEPLLIGDIEQDPRIDEYALSLYRAIGARATIVMALTLQGRWVGLFNVTWKHPIAFTQREQRLYQALAKQAALLLDNSLMVDRLRASLHATQQQEGLQQAILNHLPIGVILLEVPSMRLVLSNAHAKRMLGRMVEQQVKESNIADVVNYRFMQPGTDIPLMVDQLAAARALRSGKIETIELDIVQAQGQRVPAEATAVPITDEHGAIKQIIILLTDLSNRKRAEGERAQLQQEIIRVQAAALAERSSPIIPITDDILVLPLIGSIDTERGQQVLDTLLHGSSERGARVVILDITGVRTLDTQAASTLTSAARALRLLGVEPVLTGIRAEVAQTLVGLGVELSGITTRSTLQSGIQYALSRLGKSIIR